jgi:septum formation protein
MDLDRPVEAGKDHGITLVLASASPRRRELLSRLGLDFRVIPSDVDESLVTASRPVLLARRLARAKAEDVASAHAKETVIAADTIVVHQGDVLGKPGDTPEARVMLDRLRGRVHRVITAVALAVPGRRLRVEHVRSRVHMRTYATAEVEASIARGDPFDKAGAYAIQDPIFRPVESFEGCYCNVVGLPLWTTLHMLENAGAGVPSAALPEVCVMCPERHALLVQSS